MVGPGPDRLGAGRDHARRRRAAGLGAAPDRLRRRRRGALAAVVTIDWVLLDARGAPTRIPAEFERVFGTPQATFPLGRVELGDGTGGRRPARR